MKDRGWGGVARRGTRQFETHYDDEEYQEDFYTKKEKDNRPPLTPEEEQARAERAEKRRVDRLRLEGEAKDAIARAGGPKPKKAPRAHRRRALPGRPHKSVDLEKALTKAFGDRRAPRMAKRVRDAAKAFDEERFIDAQQDLEPVLKGAQDIAEVRELAGLTQYRLGRWAKAAKELEAFRELSGSAEQNPVLCDCYRALERWNDVDELWSELRDVSPSGPLVAEGRIVVAGGLADRGRYSDAIRLLEKSWKQPKQPKEHHLRTAYTLADLYDRAGNRQQARKLFGWLNSKAPDFADVSQRVS